MKGNKTMLYDKENLFSENQVFTASAASTNVIDIAKGNLKEVAYGTPIPLRIQVTEDYTGLTSINFKVQTCAAEGFASNVTTLAETGAVAAASLKAGYVAPINYIPKGNKGYVRIYYDVVGTATAGKVTAGIVAGNEGSWQDM